MKNRSKLYYVLMGITLASVVYGGYMAYADTNPPLPNSEVQHTNSVSQTAAPNLPNTFVAVSSSPETHSLVGEISSFAKKRPAVKMCQVIHWIPDRIYTITGSLNMGTHIILPENAIDVIVGNKDLWNESHRVNHVFIKPNSNSSDGSETTITYVGQSNTSYEFIIKRVSDDKAVPCVIVMRDGGMLNNAAWDNYESRDQRIIQLLSKQFSQKEKQIIAQQQNALDKYRGSIYTNYTWRCGGWFCKDYISDVWDDGRWTYIRVNNDNRGVMAIYGMLDGKEDVLQFRYDETTKEYRVAGIYKQLKLSYGKSSVVINRKSA